MKVQLLHLDPHDDRHSVADKLSAAQAERVVLVWPRYGRPLARRLDLVLLKRKARRHGLQLGIVSHDPEVQEAAADVGIAVFDSPDRLEQVRWASEPKTAEAIPPRRAARPTSLLARRPAAPRSTAGRILANAGRLLLFGVSVCAVLAVLAALVPSATVQLAVRAEPQSIDLSIVLDEGAEAPLADGRIPSRPAFAQVLGETRVQTTGNVSVPTEAASGTVVFTNLTTQELTVPAETGVRSSGTPSIRFHTTQDLVLDPEASAETPVVADLPGTQANLPAGALTLVEGSLALSVSVENPEPTTGGADALRAAVASADRRRAEEGLTSDLLESAREQIRSGLGPGFELAESTLRVHRRLSSQFDLEIGDAGDTLLLILELEVTGMTYRTEDLQQAGALALEQARPGQSTVPGTFQVRPQGDFVSGPTGLTQLEIRAIRATTPPIDLGELRRRLRGLRPDHALGLLDRSLELAAPAGIHIQPEWFPLLPWLADRIEIQWTWEGA